MTGKKKTLHVVSAIPDAFGVCRQALCGLYNPELLVVPGRVDVEKGGLKLPRIDDEDDENAIHPDYQICARCLRSMRVSARNKRRRSEEKR